MIVNTTRVDKDATRVEVDDQIVGFAFRLADGQWGAFDAAEKRVGDAAFKTPKAAARLLIPSN